MATKKSGKSGRATASRAKTTARSRTTKPAPKKKTAARAAKPRKAVTKPGTAKRAIAKPTRAATKAAVESAEVTALKARFQRERNTLEKHLTEAAREIGLLRHHELRAGHQLPRARTAARSLIALQQTS